MVSSKNMPLAEQLPQAFTGSHWQLVTLMCFATSNYQMEDCQNLLPVKDVLDICGNGYLG